MTEHHDEPELEAMAAALEPVAVAARPDHDGQVRLSMAISLKRIADAMGKDAAFLSVLGGVLDDASHNHAQRMSNI